MDKNTIVLEVENILKEKGIEGPLGLNRIGSLLSDSAKKAIKEQKLKLKSIIEEKSDVFEISYDKDNLPVIQLLSSRNPLVQGNDCSTVKSSEVQMEQLLSFAYIPGDAEDKLKSLILKEHWGNLEGVKESSLMKYIRYTFLKVKRENQVLERDGYACFNTGLVDKLYRSIYMVFTKNRNPDKQPYYFSDFCVEGAKGTGKKIVKLFSPLPQAAHYFDNPSDLLYYPVDEPFVDWEHIIVDNANRLPYEFLLEELNTNGDELQDIEGLRKVLESDHKILRRMTSRLKEALDIALKRTRWNYKTAIPMYYPAKDKLTLLLPLSLISEEKVDVALVVERMPNGNFLGHTILSLSDAYSNARLIARPDSDWLFIE